MEFLETIIQVPFIYTLSQLFLHLDQIILNRKIGSYVLSVFEM